MSYRSLYLTSIQIRTATMASSTMPGQPLRRTLRHTVPVPARLPALGPVCFHVRPQRRLVGGLAAIISGSTGPPVPSVTVVQVIVAWPEAAHRRPRPGRAAGSGRPCSAAAWARMRRLASACSAVCRLCQVSGWSVRCGMAVAIPPSDGGRARPAWWAAVVGPDPTGGRGQRPRWVLMIAA